MKKILFFTHKLIGGGAEKTIINLAEYINENIKNYTAYIAVVYDDPKTRNKLLSEVFVLSSKTSPTMTKIQKIPIVIKQAIELKNLKKKLEVDTCVSFLPGADFLNVLSRGSERVVSSVRNKESFFAKSIFRKIYMCHNFWKADKIIAISKNVELDIINSFHVKRDKVKTIYNPCTKMSINSKLPEEYEPVFEENRVIITAGRLTEQKGQGYLIRAFKYVHEKMPDTRLMILGAGELEEMLKRLCVELEISDKVIFTGFVRNPYDYISRAEIFVFPSIVEGLGNVLVETLQCGTPIISADCDSGPREILAPGSDYSKSTNMIEIAEYGILVPVCNGNYMLSNSLTTEEKYMAEAMLQLLSDEEMRGQYKRKSCNRIKEFEIDQIVSEWLKEL